MEKNINELLSRWEKQLHDFEIYLKFLAEQGTDTETHKHTNIKYEMLKRNYEDLKTAVK